MEEVGWRVQINRECAGMLVNGEVMDNIPGAPEVFVGGECCGGDAQTTDAREDCSG